jgi:hypothetical protein
MQNTVFGVQHKKKSMYEVEPHQKHDAHEVSTFSIFQLLVGPSFYIFSRIFHDHQIQHCRIRVSRTISRRLAVRLHKDRVTTSSPTQQPRNFKFLVLIRFWVHNCIDYLLYLRMDC